MRVLITRYPASEDRLIVRPLLCRRCALRLQPAEPQPYTTGTVPVALPETPNAAKPRVMIMVSCSVS